MGESLSLSPHGLASIPIAVAGPPFTAERISWYYTMMHRETFIAKLTEVQQTVEHLLAKLQASEHDKFAAHLYRSRRKYRLDCDHAGKSGK